MDIKDLLPRDKHDVRHIGQLRRLTDAEIAPIVPELLTWVQDVNWPVALPVVEVLRAHEAVVFPHVMEVMRGNDEMWKYWLNEYLVPTFGAAHRAAVGQVYCNVEQALAFLREHNEVALATCEDGKPKIRVFQIMKMEDTTLYFATSAVKAVYGQLRQNPHIELLASGDKVSVRCAGAVSFDVPDETCRWIYAHNPVLPRLYTAYDKLAYFKMPVAQLDYYDLRPTPPLFKHFDLERGTASSGFVGERFGK